MANDDDFKMGETEIFPDVFPHKSQVKPNEVRNFDQYLSTPEARRALGGQPPLPKYKSHVIQDAVPAEVDKVVEQYQRDGYAPWLMNATGSTVWILFRRE